MNVYAIMLNKNEKEADQGIILLHVKHLEKLDQQNRLILSGPFSDYPGGIVIIRAIDKNEAISIAEKDPLVIHGLRSYEVRSLEVANRENNYLL